MKTAVRYFSKTGNTKKLAEAVASTVGTKAKDIGQPLEEDVDILFLCNSVYWNGIDGKVKAFLKAPGHKIGKLVNVSSAALKESTYKQMKSFAAEAGISIDEREFHCRGSFMGMHKGKPDQSDIENVKKFARKITRQEVL